VRSWKDEKKKEIATAVFNGLGETFKAKIQNDPVVAGRKGSALTDPELLFRKVADMLGELNSMMQLQKEVMSSSRGATGVEEAKAEVRSSAVGAVPATRRVTIADPADRKKIEDAKAEEERRVAEAIRERAARHCAYCNKTGHTEPYCRRKKRADELTRSEPPQLRQRGSDGRANTSGTVRANTSRAMSFEGKSNDSQVDYTRQDGECTLRASGLEEGPSDLPSNIQVCFWNGLINAFASLSIVAQFNSEPLKSPPKKC
jgi:hypothetical protein